MEINDGVNYSQASRDLSEEEPLVGPRKQQLNKDSSDFSYPFITVFAFTRKRRLCEAPKQPQLDDWAFPENHNYGELCLIDVCFTF